MLVAGRGFIVWYLRGPCRETLGIAYSLIGHRNTTPVAAPRALAGELA
ncbi:protein of unknown function [Aminobacter niigataensis]|nr:protein of unknown function [Aminobacter niigataensis]